VNREKYIGMINKFAGQVYDMFAEVEEINTNFSRLPLKVVYLENYNGGEENQELSYAKDGDSGFDLRASTNEQGGYQVAPKSVIVIPTGIKVAVPQGFELQVRTRSGSPIKRGFVVANSPGTVNYIQ